jgi:predicted secreted protein
MKKKAAMNTASPVKQATTPSASHESHPPADEIQMRIAERAHELYVERGYMHGYHLHDWLEAEQEILGRTRIPGRPPAYA